MRRLPVYILIDTSGSMRGEPIESVKVGLEAMMASLRSNPYALETVCISIITYDRTATQILPLTPVDELQLPEITTPESGPTHTGMALKLLCERADAEVNRGTKEAKGDWMPLLFIMTDGKPSDLLTYNEMVPEVKRRKWGSVIGLAAGMSAKPEELLKLTDKVYRLDTLDSAGFTQFFQWMSDVINTGNQSFGATDDLALPPPPPEVNVVC